MSDKIVRIGGASGYWGDSAMATPQLLKSGNLDYIVYDYLAEITMSIMARARAKDPNAGFATDFVTVALKRNLREIAEQGVKIISNAGGVNVAACGEAVRALVAEQGLDLKVAVVEGDDLIGKRDELLGDGYQEMFSGADMPPAESVASINAYLGAFPIAAALAEGADIVITGRCVDSAVTLGACIHEFGWTPGDLDELASGSLAGHILECGPQATGGNFTDWELVADSIDSIGYPIAEMRADGSFVTTKPDGTGGIVNVGTISEQMVYEIGDPQNYMLPDVVCDFSDVVITQQGENRVHVTSAKGRGVPMHYKVSMTAADGFRGGSMLSFYGIDAERKARAFSDAVFKRARRMLRGMNAADFTETSIEIMGAESQFGSERKIEAPREVVMKMAVRHPDAIGIGVMLKETAGLGLATPPGLSGFSGGGRSKPSPVVRLFSFLIPKDQLTATVYIDGSDIGFSEASPDMAAGDAARPAEPVLPDSDDRVNVPLVKLAWGRSGDKGNKANVGIIARDAAFLPYIWAALGKERVAEVYGHFLEKADASSVERYLMPGSNTINFLLDNALGGGGVASIRNDAQAKGYAQILLATEIPVSREIAKGLA